MIISFIIGWKQTTFLLGSDQQVIENISEETHNCGFVKKINMTALFSTLLSHIFFNYIWKCFLYNILAYAVLWDEQN